MEEGTGYAFSGVDMQSWKQAFERQLTVEPVPGSLIILTGLAC